MIVCCAKPPFHAASITVTILIRINIMSVGLPLVDFTFRQLPVQSYSFVTGIKNITFKYFTVQEFKPVQKVSNSNPLAHRRE